MCVRITGLNSLSPRFDWVRPLKLGKTGKIAISSLQHTTIFDRQCSQLRIGRQWSPSLPPN